MVANRLEVNSSVTSCPEVNSPVENGLDVKQCGREPPGGE